MVSILEDACLASSLFSRHGNRCECERLSIGSKVHPLEAIDPVGRIRLATPVLAAGASQWGDPFALGQEAQAVIRVLAALVMDCRAIFRGVVSVERSSLFGSFQGGLDRFQTSSTYCRPALLFPFRPTHLRSEW